MPYHSMTSKELAAFLGMDLRQVEKMAQRGEIPCQKVAGEFRFNRAHIGEWLKQRVGSLPHDHLADMDAGITAHRQTHPKEKIVTPLLRSEAIDLQLPARTRNSVLKELVNLALQTGLLYDAEALQEALLEREELCSTAMEGGIAIPHPRRPQPYNTADSILVIARTTNGIGFGAPDGRLTDLFFLTCSADDYHHLHLLARLCRLLRPGVFVDQLRRAETPEELIALMKQREVETMRQAS